MPKKNVLLKVFKAKEGAAFSDAKAQIYGERLHELLSSHGKLTPQLVVKDARKKMSPLHEFFEWDNDEAAKKFRLHQARMLMNSIELKVEVRNEKGKNNEIKVRAFLNVKDEEQEERFYTSAEVVLSKEEYSKQIMQEALREIQYWRKKYSDLVELKPVFEVVDKIVMKKAA